MASAAADCFKALVPFFFFAAIRNRMWSQALAAALVWTVVTGYSMTSALGHAALNRLDTTGQRAVEAATYKDLRADSKRAQDQLTWIPAHRPAETVAAELNVLKAQRYWIVTKECTEVTGKSAREFCQQFHKLNAELASAQQSQKLETRIAEIGAKLAKAAGGTVMAEADPQASVLAKITGLDVETVQTALTQLRGAADRDRLGLRHVRGLRLLAPARPAEPQGARPYRSRGGDGSARRPCARRMPVAEPVPQVEERSRQPAAAAAGARLGANDNRTPQAPAARQRRAALLPRASRRRGRHRASPPRALQGATAPGARNTTRSRSPCRRSAGDQALGVRKERIGGRMRYFDIALRSAGTQERTRSCRQSRQGSLAPQGKFQRAAQAALFLCAPGMAST